MKKEEEEELSSVTERLAALGFWTTSRDPLYALFVKKWTKLLRDVPTHRVSLTREQLLEREQIAEEIAVEIAAMQERQP